MNDDEIVEQVRRAREELLKRYGGLNGWIDHLQQMDRRRTSKSNHRPKKKTAKSGAKKRTQSSVSTKP
jgi:hypothetical protein